MRVVGDPDFEDFLDPFAELIGILLRYAQHMGDDTHRYFLRVLDCGIAVVFAADRPISSRQISRVRVSWRLIISGVKAGSKTCRDAGALAASQPSTRHRTFKTLDLFIR